MKKILTKIHHFTKGELAAEEVIIIVAICILLAAGSLAASVLLPIRTRIVQCGAREDLPQKCREDQRCCALMEQLGMSLPPENDMPKKEEYDDFYPARPPTSAAQPESRVFE